MDLSMQPTPSIIICKECADKAELEPKRPVVKKESKKKLRKRIEHLQNKLNEASASLQMILDGKPGAVEMLRARQAFVVDTLKATMFGSFTKGDNRTGGLYTGIPGGLSHFATTCKVCRQVHYHDTLEAAPTQCNYCHSEIKP